MKNVFVDVPEEMLAPFVKAQENVENYFKQLSLEPSEGKIVIDGDRYILVRADILSIDFFDLIKQNYPSIDSDEIFRAAGKARYQMSKTMGVSDAKVFKDKMKVQEPLDRLAAGPIHFAYTGWAKVKIYDNSRPVSDDNYYMEYEHPNTFESESWLKKGAYHRCTCYMSAGYSAGWCTQSFDIDLDAQEVTCRSKGDDRCTFIMSRPHRLQEFVYKYENRNRL
jgi:predicted hydrocarbon binding protein